MAEPDPPTAVAPLTGGPGPDGDAADAAEHLQPGQRLARGVCRAFARHGWATLTEFTLKTGHRADVIALDGRGGIAIVEVKSSRADFTGDGKWQAYLDFCDRFYFAVPPDFPRALLPEACGVLVADPYDATTVVLPPDGKLPAARRRTVTLRFAQIASQRLLRAHDPAAFVGEV
jgi:hypothetical protein